uniref:Fatty acid binding protein 6, ileal n=1 Tax=Iconisemion striatum TaxID=60296 RepID=A0A1A7Y0T6_9TELE
MSFSGNYELESQENYVEFLEAIDFLKAKSAEKMEIRIVQDGENFDWLQFTKSWKWTSEFTLGKECEMKSMKGCTFTAHPKMEDGKILVEFPEYSFSAELVDDKLLLTSVTPGEKGVTFKRFFKRV